MNTTDPAVWRATQPVIFRVASHRGWIPRRRRPRLPGTGRHRRGRPHESTHPGLRIHPSTRRLSVCFKGASQPPMSRAVVKRSRGGFTPRRSRYVERMNECDWTTLRRGLARVSHRVDTHSRLGGGGGGGGVQFIRSCDCLVVEYTRYTLLTSSTLVHTEATHTHTHTHHTRLVDVALTLLDVILGFRV